MNNEISGATERQATVKDLRDKTRKAGEECLGIAFTKVYGLEVREGARIHSIVMRAVNTLQELDRHLDNLIGPYTE